MGRRPAAPLPGGSPRGRGAARRSARPAPVARWLRPVTPFRMTARARSDRGVLRAGHPFAEQRSPSRAHPRARPFGQTLDCDLPRQDPAPIGRTEQSEAGPGSLRSVPAWLADPTQGTTPSWLTSPTVAFLSFIATVISIVQCITTVAKWIGNLTHKEGARHQFSIALVAASLVGIAIMAPLTWAMIIADDAKIGDPGWINQLYPMMVFGTVLSGTMAVLVSIRAKRRAPIAAYFLIAMGLSFSAFTYSVAGRPVWERCLVDTIPAAIFAGFILMLLSHGISRSRVHSKA
jgi:hypothetical protein